jgi:hypothetical protein
MLGYSKLKKERKKERKKEGGKNKKKLVRKNRQYSNALVHRVVLRLPNSE